MDTSALDAAKEMFQADGLSQEQAQKYVGQAAEILGQAQQAQWDAFEQQKTEWREASAADKDFGGENFDANIAVAMQAMEKFGSPELTKVLDDTGLGNHPEVIRFMLNVGKLTKEDNPGALGKGPVSAQDKIKMLYPNG